MPGRLRYPHGAVRPAVSSLKRWRPLVGNDAAYHALIGAQRRTAAVEVAELAARFSGAELQTALDALLADLTTELDNISAAWVGILADEPTPPVSTPPPSVLVPQGVAGVALVDALTELVDAAITETAGAAVEQGANNVTRQVVGYARRPNPATPTCGLCVSAASKVYRRGDLRPIHNRCSCLNRPLFDGQESLVADYSAAYGEAVKDAGGTDRSALSNERIEVPISD